MGNEKYSSSIKKYIIEVSMPENMSDKDITDELFGLFVGSNCVLWTINKKMKTET